MENKPLEKNSKKMLIIIGVVVAIIILVIAVLQMNKQKPVVVETPKTNTPTSEVTPATPAQEAAKQAEVATALKEATIVVPGANPITKDNVVVTKTGEATKNDVSAASALAPQQTLNIPRESLPASVIKLDTSNEIGFVPNTFSVKAGAPVTVSLTNKDAGNSRTLAFTDASLVSVIIGTPPSETRAITFNAPTKPGTYNFIDGIPGHTGSGTMVVK